MSRERMMWIVALLVVASIGFYGGQTLGGRGGFAGFGGGAGGRGAGGGGTAGTVSAVAGNTLTLTTRAGQTVQVQIDANTALRKQVDAQIGDLTPGEQVVAVGAQNGDTIQASSVQIGGAGGRFGGAGNTGPTSSK